ncbi:NAD-dependent epimerase/dehydratase family protein [Bianquea renquensis]|jgi:NAD-dependent epimerase/dehydratase|uniref:NAD-dependent epimerase/dehydratase family protein n=1 Tax=Bianquea renquensis TaxID=2763661 RepID=A0A926HYK8_9FIRM|nr:NAD-dependent epimerase/dehydratase family protein [Bianquea renquensis]MBC8544952.1 NAD-dependent epimerase/dehydratase family protein [Bianquea renquensis]
MKKVLVLGATGAMGRYLIPELVNLDYEVVGVGREETAPWKVNAAYIQSDAFDKNFLNGLLKENFDGIINFMEYGKVDFSEYYQLFLEHTSHYIYLSTCRVYDDKEQPIKETSPRLLDSSEDEVLKASHDYCIYKAQDEDLLVNSSYDNWTVVRPATTFSTMRLQLVTLEFNNSVARALQGKTIVLPIQAKDKPATLSWGGDVAKMIARILFKEEAKREFYNVCSAEHRTWGEIAEYYRDLVGLEAVWVDKEDYLAILSPEGTINVRWQLEYARLFRRITDNSKVLALTGLKQEDMMPMYDGLKLEIGNIPKDYVPEDTKIGLRMDEYIKNHIL